MIDSPHNNHATPEQQLPYTRNSAEWLGLMVQGYKPLPAGELATLLQSPSVLASPPLQPESDDSTAVSGTNYVGG